MIPPESSENTKAAEFFVTLLHAATSAHILHLQSRSYSQHQALGGLYGELPDLVDAAVESYQGKYGLISSYPGGYAVPTGEAIGFVSALSDYVIANRATVASDSEIQNAIDEIQALINSTIYKLRFLA
jgi:Family of unknown function (DUF5856)